jgi:hypothetical protein
MIDWTVSVGNLLQMVAMISGGLFVFFQLRTDVRVLRHDIMNIKERQTILNEAFTQLGTILTKVAVQDERLNSISDDIKELRHGEGFINGPRLANAAAPR